MKDMAERSSPQWRKCHDLEEGEYGEFLAVGRGLSKVLTLSNDPELKAELPEDSPREMLPPGTLWFGPLPGPPPELLAWVGSQLDAAEEATARITNPTKIEATADYFPPGVAFNQQMEKTPCQNCDGQSVGKDDWTPAWLAVDGSAATTPAESK